MADADESEISDSEIEDDEGDEDDDYVRLFSHSGQFFLDEPYVYLIQPELIPERVA
jgi:hypothetical protein